MKKLPLEVLRNYTVITEKTHWELKCHVCNQAWQLKKPKKGENIHAGNVLTLIDHIASHPLPDEAVVEEAPPPTSETTVGVVLQFQPKQSKAPPEFKVIKNREVPSENAYKIEWYGNETFCHMVKISHFNVQQGFPTYKQVQQVGDNQYKVVLQAANHKHAQLVGERLIRRFFDQQKERSV
jgi:hypothetical protein